MKELRMIKIIVYNNYELAFKELFEKQLSLYGSIKHA